MTRTERPVQLFVWAATLALLVLLGPLTNTDQTAKRAATRRAAIALKTTSSTSTTTASPSTALAPKPITTTTTRVCRDSFDLACGPFRWDPPPPANQAGAAQIIVVPPQPRVGQQVTLHIIAVDPDNTFTPAVCGVYSKTDFGDGAVDFADCYRGAICRAARGPWTPPAGTRDTYTIDRDHSYAAPGTYVIAVDLLTNRYGVSLQGTNDGPGDARGTCVDPYASAIHAEATVTVSPR